jgi:hypothetical protein
MEMNYSEYAEFVNKLMQAEVIWQAVNDLKPLGKFVMTDTCGWEPFYYPGFTLITPTLEEDYCNADAYRILLEVKKKVLLKHINPAKGVEAPDQALHMTVARLISGKDFETNTTELYDNFFLSHMKELLSKLAVSGQLRFEIKGISVFPQGVIAAVVSPVNEADYNCLQNFRDFVYSDRTLQELGVERRRMFHGHISLFYIEKELDHMEKQILQDEIDNINKLFFEKPLPFHIKRAEVRRFNNFLSFDHVENGPVFEFI